jgi:hypothetical protein
MRGSHCNPSSWIVSPVPTVLAISLGVHDGYLGGDADQAAPVDVGKFLRNTPDQVPDPVPVMGLCLCALAHSSNPINYTVCYSQIAHGGGLQVKENKDNG